MLRRTVLLLPALTVLCAAGVLAQQVPDRDFRPVVASSAYAEGKGPPVCLDEAHSNFHTLDNRFWGFGELLRRDGYAVRANRAPFDAATLSQCAILVISNAQPNNGSWNDYPYPTPSAFAATEVDAVRLWVQRGGSLLLIADHMPLAGAAASLAAAFGVTFNNGFAIEGFATEDEREAAFAKPTIFRLRDGTLRDHVIVRGRNERENVTAIRTFTGQAFEVPSSAAPLMVFPPSFISLMPRVAWQFGPETIRVPVGGRVQGAVMPAGAGRAAFFGEAAMFTTQVTGPQRRPMGMNAPGAEQNAQFVLNLMHWLSKLL